MSELDLDKFIKIIGLFGSAHEGERANAAALATKMLRDADLNWEEFFELITAPPPTPTAGTHSQVRSILVDHKDATERCLLHRRHLTKWERQFLESLQHFPYLSAKQHDVLERICRRCMVPWP
jgi:hypothetical protein